MLLYYRLVYRLLRTRRVDEEEKGSPKNDRSRTKVVAFSSDRIVWLIDLTLRYR